MNKHENNESHQSLIKIDKEFSELIKLKSIIPDEMKVKIFEGSLGKTLPTLKEWENFLNFEFYLHGFENLKNFGYSLSNDEIQYLKDCDSFVEELTCHTIRDYIGWGIPCEENIQHIILTLNNKKSEGLLEIGCGSGYWSSVFKNRLTIDVKACELNLRGDTPKPFFFDALNIDAENAMNLFPTYDILLVWPDINKVGNLVISKMTPGQLLILETNIDVTANNDFYKELDSHFDLNNTTPSIEFSGSSQYTYLLTKRVSPKSDLENTHFFEEQHKPYIKKLKKLKK